MHQRINIGTDLQDVLILYSMGIFLSFKSEVNPQSKIQDFIDI